MYFCSIFEATAVCGAKRLTSRGICYSEEDFIAYLNQYVFSEERSVPVKNLGRMNLGEDLPEEYRGWPCFHF